MLIKKKKRKLLNGSECLIVALHTMLLKAPQSEAAQRHHAMKAHDLPSLTIEHSTANSLLYSFTTGLEKKRTRTAHNYHYQK